MPVIPRLPNTLFERVLTDQQAEQYRNVLDVYRKNQGWLESGTPEELEQRLRTAEPGQHADILIALIYAFLVTSKGCDRWTRALAAASREQQAACAQQLLSLVWGHYPTMRGEVRKQVLQLTGHLVSWQAGGVDGLFFALMRHVQSYSTSGWSVWLAVELIAIFEQNFAWLCQFHPLCQSFLYMLLRTLPEAHKGAGAPPLESLRVRGSALALRVLTQRWEDCVTHGGRDIVRALLEVSKMPEFAGVWRDLLNGRVPGSEEASTSGRTESSERATGGRGPGTPLATILSRRSPPKLFLSRVTPEMEQHMYFFLTQVRMGNHKRYQQWYVDKHLSGANADAIIADLTRYLCVVFHPSPSLLSSDIMPRWALLWWLQKLPRTYVGQANARLALFFDWYFFDATQDPIMNVEPVVLLLTQGVARNPAVINTLLEFLFLSSDTLWPQHRSILHAGLQAGVAKLCQKGLLKSLQPLVTCQELSSGLRTQLRRIFPTACGDAAPSAAERSQASTGAGPPHSTSAAHGPVRTSSSGAMTHPRGTHQTSPAPGERDRSRSSTPQDAAARGGLRATPSVEPPGPGPPWGPRKRPAEGREATPPAKRAAPPRDRGTTPPATTEAPTEQPLQKLGAALQHLEEVCVAGKVEQLEAGVGRVLETLLEAEKPPAQSQNGQKAQLSVPDLEAEWGGLRVALAGFLQTIKKLVSPEGATSEKAPEPVHWLPNVPLPGSGTIPLEETLGGALLVCAEEEDGNPKGTAAVRLAGALRCCEPSATLGAHLLRRACLLEEYKGSSTPSPEKPRRQPAPVPGDQAREGSDPAGKGVAAQEAAGPDSDEDGDDSLFRLYLKICGAAMAVSGEGAESAGVLPPGSRLDAPIGSIQHCLVADLRTCLLWGPDMVPIMAPALLAGLPEQAPGNPDILYLTCALALPAHVMDIAADVALRKYSCCFPGDVQGEDAGSRMRNASSSAEANGAGQVVRLQQCVASGVALVASSRSWDPQAQQALWHILVPEALSRGVTFAAALAADLLQGLGPSDLEVPKNGVTRGPGRAGPPQGTGACPKQAASLLGLGQLLRCVPPSRQLLDALWGLDARLQGFVASVLSAWQAMSSAWVAWAGNSKGTNGPRGPATRSATGASGAARRGRGSAARGVGRRIQAEEEAGAEAEGGCEPLLETIDRALEAWARHREAPGDPACLGQTVRAVWNLALAEDKQHGES